MTQHGREPGVTSEQSSLGLTSIGVELIGSALESISDEMGEALVRASYSPNIKERRDCTTCLFDAHGNALAQAEHIPIHLGSLMGIIGAIRTNYDLNDIRDGDTFIGNDPHTGGGTHLPDIVLATPVFHEGRLMGWVTNLAHHSDYADRSHAHIFQEGIRIPAVRLLRDWTVNPEIMRLLLTNFQVPQERVADFNAQIAANRLGVRRFRDVLDKYGVEHVEAASSELLNYTERKVRAAIRKIPNGVYEFTDVFDCNELSDVYELKVAMTVEDESLAFSFDAPEQVRAGVNMVITALQATVFYAVKAVIGPDVPANAGLHRAITVRAPEGSLLNCKAPAAVNGRTQTCQRVVDLVLGAFAKAVPDKVIAACNGAVTAVTFSGVDPRREEYYVYLETIGGGIGAGCGWDGMDGVQAHITNTSNLPVESLEAEYPLTVTEYGLIDDSGGLGEHRGGMGIRRSIEVDHDGCHCDARIGRTKSQPWGLFGGQPARTSSLKLNGDTSHVTSNKMMLGRGDTITVNTAGGGGYGDPAARPAALVEHDILTGAVSAQTVSDVLRESLDDVRARARVEQSRSRPLDGSPVNG